MSIRDQLWGGGSLEAPSPEVASPVPPSAEETRELFETARRGLRERQELDNQCREEHAEHIKDIVFGGPSIRFLIDREETQQLSLDLDK